MRNLYNNDNLQIQEKFLLRSQKFIFLQRCFIRHRYLLALSEYKVSKRDFTWRSTRKGGYMER